MTLTQRAFNHNSSAFVAELHEAAAARRMRGDQAGALDIDRTAIALQAGEAVENDWTITIARRFLHDA